MIDSVPHIPVLLDEVLAGLQPAPGAALIDGTLGAGGHSAAWLEAATPAGRVLGFDRDPAAVEIARSRLARFGERMRIVQASYVEMQRLAAIEGFSPADAVLLDLGFSSIQIDDPARGFAFSQEGPLDMRFDPAQGIGAADLLNTYPEEEIANLIYRYGEERHSRRIARAIIAARPLETTTQLAAVVMGAVPRSKEKIHPATRTFQALRIAVNGELEALEAVLPQAVELLRVGGRLAVIGFHSLEDRIVKQFIRHEAAGCICPPRQPVCTCEHVPRLTPITRKPITATEQEIAANPRARSAKLRIAERI